MSSADLHLHLIPIVLARLKSETRAEHNSIEATLGLTRPDLTAARYCQILKRFRGFYQPVEARISSIAGWGPSNLDFEPRRKVHLLDTDLKSLGVSTPERLPVCQDLPTMVGVTAAFGCLYVLEGSTLGGQVVGRHIHKTIGMTPSTGGRFFYGYGDQTAAMWQVFRTALTAFAVSDSAQNQVVTAAISTFQSFRRWCEKEVSQ